jgi:hypothetical protein
MKSNSTCPARRALSFSKGNQVSKIMRRMYAEARAAREAVSGPGGSRICGGRPPVPSSPASGKLMIDRWTLPVPEPVAMARSTIEWWTVQLAEKRQ